MQRVRRRQALSVGAALATGSLAGCAFVQKKLGLVSPDDVLRQHRHLYSDYQGEPPADAPDRDRGIWWEFENVSDQYTVAVARYTLTAETETKTVLEETVTLRDFGVGQTEDWYFELPKDVTNEVTLTESAMEQFELK